MMGSTAVAEAGITVNIAIGSAEKDTDCTQYFDKALLEQPIVIRSRRDGDTITLQGGTKKLKEYFIDEKIPRHKRDKMPLFACGSNILWAIGTVRANAYRPQNAEALMINFKGDHTNDERH